MGLTIIPSRLNINPNNERTSSGERENSAVTDRPSSQCVHKPHVEYNTEYDSSAHVGTRGVPQPKKLMDYEVEQNQIQDRRRRIDDVLE